MYRVAIIGDRESVQPFSVVGFAVSPVENYETAKLALNNYTSKNFAIIYVTEEYAKLLQDEINKFKDRSTPAIIVVPNNKGSDGMGATAVRKAIERAVGSDFGA